MEKKETKSYSKAQTDEIVKCLETITRSRNDPHYKSMVTRLINFSKVSCKFATETFKLWVSEQKMSDFDKKF